MATGLWDIGFGNPHVFRIARAGEPIAIGIYIF
jgi:hypothetical protein